jgi:hypothetical protein
MQSKRRFIEDNFVKRDLEKELDIIILKLKKIRKELKKEFRK